MPIDRERLQHGRALIDGALGGAKPAASLAGLIAATAEAFALTVQPAERWPDYVAQALAEVDSDLERLASAKAELVACQATRDSAKAEADRVRQSAEVNAGYLAEAEAELTRVKVELAKATAEIRDLWRVRDRAQARANNAEKREADRLAGSLIVAAESEERGEALAELVAILAAMPLDSFWQWPDLAACYGKARRLGQEEPAERWTRLQAKIGRAANG